MKVMAISVCWDVCLVYKLPRIVIGVKSNFGFKKGFNRRYSSTYS